ncbi:MAG: hypothetical protein OXL96_06465 [Candidatus Poribacteria bacterium]|nr:hypothetical protein [Candidatus Poribacteria bacterium]
MASNKYTLQDALHGQLRKSEKRPTEESEKLFFSDLKELRDTLEGQERVDAFIVRIQRYATESMNLSVDDDFKDVEQDTLDQIQRTIRDILRDCVSLFISDEHRKFVVRCHAQGISTTDAVSELIRQDKGMNRLAHDDALGLKLLRDTLIHRLSYLKPGTARWPEKKYGSVWREARDAYKQMINDMPLTSPMEQAAILVKHANRLNYALENDSYTVKDLQILTNSLTKTIESLRKVSVVEEQAPASLSAPQLVAVLERLTLALDAPEQLALSGDTDTLVTVLEQLTLALKTSGQQALGEGAEASVQETEVVSTENGVNGGGRKT